MLCHLEGTRKVRLVSQMYKPHLRYILAQKFSLKRFISPLKMDSLTIKPVYLHATGSNNNAQVIGAHHGCCGSGHVDFYSCNSVQPEFQNEDVLVGNCAEKFSPQKSWLHFLLK